MLHRRCSRRERKERARTTLLPSLVVLTIVWPVSLLLACIPTPTAGFLIAAAAAMSAPGSSGMGLGDIGGQHTPGAETNRQEACSSRGPSWRRDLEEALEKNKADVHSRFLQLATVRVHQEGTGR